MPSGYPYPMYPAGASGASGTNASGQNTSRYPSARPLPAHYPVPGGAQPSNAQQQYPSHPNPLSGAAAPPPVNPWGFPDPQHAAQHPPPPRVAAAPATPSTPPAPPATRPDNMSSLTNYCVKVKDQFVLPPKVPPAKLEPVKPCSHNLATALEDEILSQAEAQRLEATSPVAGGAAAGTSGDLLGGMSALDVGGRSGAVALPSTDCRTIAIDLYSQLKAGSKTAIQLALAKYDADDEEKIMAFCDNFDKCKEVASEASDLEVAAALFVTDEKQQQWRQEAMHVLMG